METSKPRRFLAFGRKATRRSGTSGKHAFSLLRKVCLFFVSHLLQLFGPPGCGKTVIVRAIASETKLPCLIVTPSLLLRKYVGETNLQIRTLFQLARKLSPCILCLDELDGLFRERSSTEHDVTRDLKTEFLQFWDGISSSEDSRILVVGATNRPFDIDPAVLRRMVSSALQLCSCHFLGLRLTMLDHVTSRIPAPIIFRRSATL